MYILRRIYIYISTHSSINVYMHTLTRVYICILLHAHMCAYFYTHIYMYMLTRIYIYIPTHTHTFSHTYLYREATISRHLKIIGLFRKKALLKRIYSAEETHSCKEPTNRSHPICLLPHPCLIWYMRNMHKCIYIYIYIFIYTYTYTVHTFVQHRIIFILTRIQKKSQKITTPVWNTYMNVHMYMYIYMYMNAGIYIPHTHA